MRGRSARRWGYRFWKRTLDVLFSFLLLVFLSLPMLAVGLAIRLTSKGPAIFRQTRIGRDGVPFTCYKFRTMFQSAPNNCPTAALVDARRYITPIGRFLRRSSLDELPQLWNVLRGDMSLVGPRPLIPREGQIHMLRRRTGVYAVRPGMTGLAQINGRDLLADRDKARLDARYAKTLSFSQDLRIIGKTLFGVFFGKDVAEGAKHS